MVSGDSLGGDCPVVKGLPLGRRVVADRGALRGAGGRLADAPALPSPVETEPQPLVLSKLSIG